jgi:hypothetical protein
MAADTASIYQLIDARCGSIHESMYPLGARSCSKWRNCFPFVGAISLCVDLSIWPNIQASVETWVCVGPVMEDVS